ncbi:MAG: GNAT family N-acetyltransferase [Gammaproteobacteria bacterium]|nr:GNAT family N-acetyltransferase [Gammaproteobacteria bacterium]
MNFKVAESLSTIPAEAWNALAGDNPFIQHDFLLALETGHCLQPYGWHPQYMLVFSDDDQLIGASPAYRKTNSYGEFVFDWAWADAYQRAGLIYYPKLVIAVPYSPVNGPRLLTRKGDTQTAHALVDFAIELAKQQNLSTVHWLFNTETDYQIEQQHDLLNRFDYQFHWSNDNYQNFEDFLSELSSKKRKNIKRERRKVKESGIEIKILTGDKLNEELWQQVYNFYQITFMKKSGTATLSLDFFKAIAHKIVTFIAFDGDKPVAAAICIKGGNGLYGRHWGSYEDYDSLHFELCYYTGIEYCINNQLQHFEPGAQGEHKIARGFLPVKTVSSHWVAHPEFKRIIEEHLQRESEAMENYGEELNKASPFRKTKS